MLLIPSIFIISIRQLILYASFLCLYLICFNSWADDTDTSLRLNQSIELRAEQQEQNILKDEDYLHGERPTLTVNGQRYAVQHNKDDVGRALYLSIQQKEWSAVDYFLKEYLYFPDADPLLLAYARGALARMHEDLDTAQQQYRELLALKPDFLPGQLELARVLFENREDGESETFFKKIALTLTPANAQQQGLSQTVDSFLNALENRQSWQGSFSIGPTWVDNLNQSSETYTCLQRYNDFCLYERKTPEAIKAQGIDYEATLNKRFAISGHHGIFFRSLLYGQNYKDQSIYNESQLNSQIGYSYHDRRNQYSLAPSFEFSRYGNTSMYGAWGTHGEWLHYLSDKAIFKLEADYKKQEYLNENIADLYDGNIWSTYATAWYALPNDWTIFGGLDWTHKQAKIDTNAYQQIGIRAGVSKIFNKHINAVLFASIREQEYGVYNALLGELRDDVEQNYTLIVRFPSLSIYGLEPSLTLKHRKVHSNIDWLYSHERNAASLRLEKRF
ncbi:hypothetical protein LCGC14_0467940 [marine sediment metagenome]|uniref:DUF560 domain-containing protein n=1 Tax=marine sediment metagenome TaxID=412755 RepID=A0A0F9SW24_9ZZZZ|nr:DUF560 domain-containing protein [Methylophaga sp.]HEC58771.1 DUF560 domain-containing protein [Methylophaga sp.]